ncbi:MAG TPA: 3'-5' exonuclease, partial [Bacteroidales bacterium]|nr:3'-5' exonuclease [Bacteroidales bacterium]
NLFPSSMNNFSPKELEEERRLFYVALTRACNRVTLSYSLNRYKWGSLEHSSPSRFINEIDKTFLDYPQTGGKPFGQAGRQNDQSFREREPGFDRIPSARNLKPVAGSARVISPSPSGPVQYDLLPGDSVTHERFGEGIVDSIEGEAPNTTAVIDFKGVGSKKLLLRFAKLTKRGSSK